MKFFDRLSQKMELAGSLKFWKKPEKMDYPFFSKVSKSQPAPSFGSDGQKSSCHTFLKAFNPLFQAKKSLAKNNDF